LLHPLFKNRLRADVFDSLGHGHPLLLIENLPTVCLGAGGFDLVLHSWCLGTLKVMHVSAIGVPVDCQMEALHRPCPDTALSHFPATGESRQANRSIHATPPYCDFSGGGLPHRRIPAATASAYYRVRI
jgi:hypothetical protein